MVSELEMDQVRLRDGRMVSLRAATPDDAAAIVAYMHGVLPEVRPCIVTTPEEFTATPEQQRTKNQERTENGGILLLAWASGEVVGSCTCEVATRRRLAHRGMIGMTIRQAWWGVGLGEAMLRWIVDWATAHPAIIKLSLAVYPDNERAIRLYRKCGFVEEGRRICEVQREPGEFVDDILMYRFVKPLPGVASHGHV